MKFRVEPAPAVLATPRRPISASCTWPMLLIAMSPAKVLPALVGLITPPRAGELPQNSRVLLPTMRRLIVSALPKMTELSGEAPPPPSESVPLPPMTMSL